MHRALLPGFACLFAMGIAPQSAQAAPSASASVSTSGGAASSGGRGSGPSASGKRFRFHVATDVLSLVHFNPDGANNDFNTTRLGFGIGRRTFLDSSSTGGSGVGGVGVGGGVTSLGFGAIILDGHAVVGGQFAFAVDGLDVGDEGGTLVEGRFVPYFNYMFSPIGRVTPFVGAHFGLGGGAFSQRVDNPIDDDDDGRSVLNVIYPVVGAQGGAHIFIVDAISVDVMFNFDYLAPFARLKLEGVPGDDGDDEDFDKVGDVINVAFVSVGLSAWF